jgi:hypothetical protein
LPSLAGAISGDSVWSILIVVTARLCWRLTFAITARSPLSARRERSGAGFFFGGVTPDYPAHRARYTRRVREALTRSHDQLNDFILLAALAFGWHKQMSVSKLGSHARPSRGVSHGEAGLGAANAKRYRMSQRTVTMFPFQGNHNTPGEFEK